MHSKRRRNVSEDEDGEAIRHNRKKINDIQKPPIRGNFPGSDLCLKENDFKS